MRRFGFLWGGELGYGHIFPGQICLLGCSGWQPSAMGLWYRRPGGEDASHGKSVDQVWAYRRHAG